MECPYVAGWLGLAVGALPGWRTYDSGIAETVPSEEPELHRLALRIARELAGVQGSSE